MVLFIDLTKDPTVHPKMMLEVNIVAGGTAGNDVEIPPIDGIKAIDYAYSGVVAKAPA